MEQSGNRGVGKEESRESDGEWRMEIASVLLRPSCFCFLLPSSCRNSLYISQKGVEHSIDQVPSSRPCFLTFIISPKLTIVYIYACDITICPYIILYTYMRAICIMYMIYPTICQSVVMLYTYVYLGVPDTRPQCPKLLS